MRIYIYERTERDSARHFLVRSPNWPECREWFVRNRIPAMWDPAWRGWFVHRARLSDVTTQLESEGHTVTVRDIASPASRRSA